MREDHERFMAVCLAEARSGGEKGNNPVGSVIVRQGEIVGVGHNTVVSEANPLNHAEMVAIQDAFRRIGSGDLSDATLYSCLEPCPMCCWATHVAGIRRIVLGGRHANIGSSHVGDYSIERLMALTRQQWELVTGVLQEECEELRRTWNARMANLDRQSSHSSR